MHDATAFSGIYQTEMLGFCEPGRGGPLAESGRRALVGASPSTPPGAALQGPSRRRQRAVDDHRIAVQLRGEAGARQVNGARVGLVENGGGILGLEEAACAVTVLQKA